MRRYITAFVIFTMLFLNAFSIAKAECTEITGDVIETQQNFQFHGNPPGTAPKKGDTVTVDGPDFKSTATIIGTNPDGSYKVGIVTESKNANVDMKTAQYGKEAWEDSRDSNTHTSKGRGDNVGEGFFSDVKSVDGNKVYSEATLHTGNTQASEIYDKAAAAKKDPSFDAKTFLDTQTNLKEGTPAYNNMLRDITNNNSQQLGKIAEQQRSVPQTSFHAKTNVVKSVVCKKTPGVDLCDDFANWPDPQPMTCYNGTVTPSPGSCSKSIREDGPISSYTTRTPLLNDPLTRNFDLCDLSDKRNQTFETMSTFSKYSGKIKANQKKYAG